MSAEPPFVLVTVGTEHYAFDRLIEWMDTWLTSEPGRGVRCLVQHGVSRSPRQAEGRAFLPFDEMLAATARASALVCHGGTGSVMLARHEGLKPIVVPRTHRYGEHVDDHQVAFARRMAARGDVELAESEERLHGLLDAVVEGRLEPRSLGHTDGISQAIARFCELVDAMMANEGRRR